MAVTNQKPNGAALFIPGSVLKREISSVVYLICFFLCRRLGYEERDSGTPHPYPSSQAIGQNCPLKSENKSMNCVPASVFHLVLLAISVLGTGSCLTWGPATTCLNQLGVSFGNPIIMGLAGSYALLTNSMG
jgi:hypothetical protein